MPNGSTVAAPSAHPRSELTRDEESNPFHAESLVSQDETPDAGPIIANSQKINKLSVMYYLGLRLSEGVQEAMACVGQSLVLSSKTL